MLAAFLQADETADAKARLIAYGYCSGYKGVVATLILSKAGVKIGIPYGVTLPDPTGLLEGAGKIHRHVVIASRADLARRALSTLLRATLAAWQERSRRA